ncbi:hypothetical protein BMETH_1590_1 [methanotrophic bacterial endosymbiont of Bathymodiolus sp.]|nr:hypothetical protein BMETH_1590_1 [methanotrophic bacterial endosymbiont of Bathymodiolus sp.]
MRHLVCFDRWRNLRAADFTLTANFFINSSTMAAALAHENVS